MFIKSNNKGQLYIVEDGKIKFLNIENYKELFFEGGDLLYDSISHDIKISDTSLQINGKTINIPETELHVYNKLYDYVNGNPNYTSIDLNVSNSFLCVIYVESNNDTYEIKIAITNIGKDLKDGINTTVLEKLENKDWLIQPDFSDNSTLVGFILIKCIGMSFNISNPNDFSFKSFPLYPLIKKELLEDIEELTFTESNYDYILKNIIENVYKLDISSNYNLFLNNYFLFEGSKFFIELTGGDFSIYKSNITSNLLPPKYTDNQYYKKSTATASGIPPHFHNLSDISDFPVGNNGDIFVHNGTQWGAGDLVMYRTLSWFKSNQTSIMPKNRIICLQGTTFYKITDGVSQLKDIQWANGGININGQNISINGENYYRYDSSLSNYMASNARKQSSMTSVQTTSLDSNALRGQFIILKQPSTLNHIGINITTASGLNAKVIFLIYSVNFNSNTATLITSSSSTPTNINAVGFYRNTNPFNLDLIPGVYMIAYANIITSGSGTVRAIYTENTEFQLHRLNSDSFPQYLQTSYAAFVTSISLSSPPSTVNLSGVTNSQLSNLIFYWFNPIN
jgi:hypothetical protein